MRTVLVSIEFLSWILQYNILHLLVARQTLTVISCTPTLKTIKIYCTSYHNWLLA